MRGGEAMVTAGPTQGSSISHLPTGGCHKNRKSIEAIILALIYFPVRAYSCTSRSCSVRKMLCMKFSTLGGGKIACTHSIRCDTWGVGICVELGRFGAYESRARIKMYLYQNLVAG